MNAMQAKCLSFYLYECMVIGKLKTAGEVLVLIKVLNGTIRRFLIIFPIDAFYSPEENPSILFLNIFHSL